jgi:protoporphyrinogen oxidase
VDEFQRQMPRHHKLHLNTVVRSVTRVDGKAVLGFADGSVETFDHVVLAIHANQAVSLLGHDASALERRILGAFTTRRNVCYLHSDESVSFFHFLFLFIFPNETSNSNFQNARQPPGTAPYTGRQPKKQPRASPSRST